MLSDISEKAVDVIVKTQKPAGMWSADYSKDDGSDDVEASVWQILALKAAYICQRFFELKKDLESGIRLMM